MSLIDPDEVEAVMSTGLEPAALQGVIDRDEDWLAFDPRVGIGQLAGERDQTVWRPGGSREPILLPRTTDAVVVLDNGAAVEVELLGRSRVEPTSGRWRGPKIVLTYTPNDVERVKRVLFDLFRMTYTSSPFGQEATEGHSYSRPRELDAQRCELARTLHAQRGPFSVSMRAPTLVSRDHSW